ncbi:unnamed protein product [Paramecium octaurelia]|uniref:Uncharacterized protein n=1 Tax=Paramecium octaurelia TaxID=43137 RepID=A0A8S1UBB2_PAROT|nr:unnamed protein product [Paramecium octaurelia]
MELKALMYQNQMNILNIINSNVDFLFSFWFGQILFNIQMIFHCYQEQQFSKYWKYKLFKKLTLNDHKEKVSENNNTYVFEKSSKKSQCQCFCQKANNNINTRRIFINFLFQFSLQRGWLRVSDLTLVVLLANKNFDVKQLACLYLHKWLLSVLYKKGVCMYQDMQLKIENLGKKQFKALLTVVVVDPETVQEDFNSRGIDSHMRVTQLDIVERPNGSSWEYPNSTLAYFQNSECRFKINSEYRWEVVLVVKMLKSQHTNL